MTRRRGGIGDRDGFAGAQFEDPGREARRGSVDRDLRPGTAGNDDRLGTLSDGVEPPAHRIGAAASVVGQHAIRVPGKRNRAHWVVSGIIDDSRIGTQWRRAIAAVLSKRIAGDQPVC